MKILMTVGGIQKLDKRHHRKLMQKTIAPGTILRKFRQSDYNKRLVDHFPLRRFFDDDVC